VNQFPVKCSPAGHIPDIEYEREETPGKTKQDEDQPSDRLPEQGIPGEVHGVVDNCFKIHGSPDYQEILIFNYIINQQFFCPREYSSRGWRAPENDFPPTPPVICISIRSFYCPCCPFAGKGIKTGLVSPGIYFPGRNSRHTVHFPVQEICQELPNSP
jgi:hypothetical protein